MEKKNILLKIFIPILILLLVLLLVGLLLFKGTSDAGEAVSLVFALILNIIPMGCYIPIGVALLILEILLFCLPQKEKSVLISVLVFLCILFPILVFSLYIDFFVMSQFNTFILVVGILTIVVYLITFVLSAISVAKTRKIKE